MNIAAERATRKRPTLSVTTVRPWVAGPAPRSYGAGDLARDAIAGLTLAAIAVPAQMATARLGGFAPQIGFFAFIAATFGFCLLGSSCFVSVGADSTITPIFAGALGLLAVGAPHNGLALAQGLALMVGAIVILAGLFRMGWIADLLSVPVTIGFLAGISVHIIVSQLPGALGLPAGSGDMGAHLRSLILAAPRLNSYDLAIAGGVLAITAGAHRLSVRLPGPLIAIVASTLAVVFFDLDHRGVAVLGHVQGGLPRLSAPLLTADTWLGLTPLALMIALIVMVQTAATSRGFPSDPDKSPDLSRDYIGVGAGNVLAALVGAFPVDASPPSTAAVAESGGRSRLAGAFGMAAVVLILVAGTSLLERIPQAALSGVLFFIALRIIRFGQIAVIARSSPAEALLILITAGAIIALPIASGVAVGIGLSLALGMWSSARAKMFTMERISGTTVWWPKTPETPGETLAGVSVLGFQAPLSFINAYEFRGQFAAALAADPTPRLIVLEATGIIDIDFTAAEVFKDVIRLCREAGCGLAIARLEAADAQNALTRLGLRDLIGGDHVFPTVAQAIDALAPSATPIPTSGDA